MVYCKECGEKYSNDAASFCISCGVKKGNGNKYCNFCGIEKKSDNQDVCLNCGNEFKKISIGLNSGKTKLVLLLLWFFLGGFGVHHFYVGNIGKGILYLCLTLVGFITFGITNIVVFGLLIFDLVYLLTDKFTDSSGNAITNWT